MSKDPIHTNIVPAFFNTIYQDKCGDPNIPAQEKMNCPTVLPGSDKLTTPEMIYKQQKVYSGPMFQKPQFLQNQINGNSEINPLTGLPKDNYHNNMVPFFGAKVTQNVNVDSSTSNHLIEKFTGSGDIPNRHKQEIEPMFELRRENTFGTPNTPDELRLERYVQSNMKTNILPAPQYRVQPLRGLKKIRPRFYDIDQLRVSTNPQITYAGRIQAPPRQEVQNRGLQAPVIKNRPPKWHNYGPDRFTPAFKYIPNAKLPENFEEVLKCQHRQTTNNDLYMGVAHATEAKGFRPTICRPKINPNNSKRFSKFLQ